MKGFRSPGPAQSSKTCHQHRSCLRKRAEEETETEVPEPSPVLLPPAALPRSQIIERAEYLLLEWIRQAEQDTPKPMRGFAGLLRQDLDADTAGLTLPWSSGVVEGHVNRVKTLKRATYGRASFELLRTRILTQ
ncbi:transposase [Streptomyces sp. NPDC007205]|uniref:transposase n=1 Tax=Streptomyces sp. NPDC007205 TaxID=3154316 RepID=UPI00340EF87B